MKPGTVARFLIIASGALLVALLLARCGERPLPSGEVRGDSRPGASAESRESGASLRFRSSSTSRSETASGNRQGRHTPPAQGEKGGTAASSSSGSSVPQLEIHGHVRLAGTGTPAAGAQVWVASAESIDAAPLASATGDAGGVYRLRVLKSQTPLVLYAALPGYAVEGRALPADALSTASEAGAVLTLDLSLQRSASLRGQVVNDSGGPVPGAHVVASRLSLQPSGPAQSTDASSAPAQNGSLQTWEGLTDTAGRFALEEIPAGEFTLEVSREGFVAAKQAVEAPAGSLVVRLSTGGAGLTGHVFHHATRSGVSGARIQLEEDSPSQTAGVKERTWSAVTDDLGAFSFSALPEGTYRIHGTIDGLTLRSAEPLENGRVKLSASETTPELTFLLHPGRTVRGRVTDENQMPLEGVTVTATGETVRTARTDSEGLYRLEGIEAPAGSPWMAMRFEKPGFALQGEKPGASLLLRLDGGQDEFERNARLEGATIVSGLVTDSDGNCLANATVEASPDRPGSRAETDSSGRFEVLVRPRSYVVLKARAEGFGEGYSSPLTVDGESTSGVEIVLTAGASVRGMVVDEDGHPSTSTSVNVFLAIPDGGGLGTHVTSMPTDESGHFFFEKLPARRLEFSTQPMFRETYAPSRPEILNLSPGERREDVRLVLRRARQISGIVVDREGHPISGVFVSAMSAQYNASEATNAEGHFRLFGPGEGEVTLMAHGRIEYDPATLPGVAAGRSDLRLVLEKSRPVTLVGSVVDGATGEPVADFDLLDESGSPIKPGPVRPSGGDKAPHLLGSMIEYRKEGPGAFTLSGLNSGQPFRLMVRAPGYQSLDTHMGRIPPARDIPGGGTIFEVTFPLIKAQVP